MNSIRLKYLIILILLIPIGLGTKFYTGPLQDWVHAYAGDIFYPMFWYFLFIFFLPRMNPLIAALVIFSFCTAIEFTQLLSSPLLESIRSHFLGRTLIGVQFVAMDILYYGIGCVLAVGLQKILLLLWPQTNPQIS